MSEAELHLIRARLDGGLRNKAERGELKQNLPVGLDRDEEGQIVLCADEQVRHAIGRVFCLWRGLGSARQVVRELLAEGQLLPRRTVGQRRVRWKRASYAAVHDFLTNPAYAGAFAFGRTSQKKALDGDGRVRRRTRELPIEEWSVCIRDHHPGYVSWDQYLATGKRPRANVRPRGEGGGAAREGGALLQGMLRCGRCGRRMQVAYSGRDGNVPRLCLRARPRPPRHGEGLPVARRDEARPGRRRRLPRGRHPGQRFGVPADPREEVRELRPRRAVVSASPVVVAVVGSGCSGQCRPVRWLHPVLLHPLR